MLATGLPADGGDAAAPEELENGRLLQGSYQHLVNPPSFHPTRKASVDEWAKARAARELRPPAQDAR